MADRLISADALMDEIAKVKKHIKSENSDYLTGYVSALSGVEGQIAYQPTIDAVPVVRCKDCIHWYEPEGVCLKIYSDGAVSPYAWQFRKHDDFCSYGERRTDERKAD